MLPLMSPQDVKRKLEAGEIRLVDIREPDEVESLRIEGAEIAPLSVIRWQDFRPVTDKPVVFTCNSGRRTKNNSDLLEQLAAGEAWQMEGGATAWDKAGLPVVRSRRSLPMFRQIQIGAGGMVLLGLALGKGLHAFVMSQIRVDMVSFDVRVSLGSYLLSLGLTMLFAVGVDLLLSRKIERIDMADALKSVE